eukprot:8631378-Heterocapsa_arctica.AAC.1
MPRCRVERHGLKETGIIETILATDDLKLHEHAGNMMEANVRTMKVDTFVGSVVLGVRPSS